MSKIIYLKGEPDMDVAVLCSLPVHHFRFTFDGPFASRRAF